MNEKQVTGWSEQMNSKIAIYQSSQIREFEKLAGERFGISGQVMMQRAGNAACECLLREFPKVHKIAVFCGSGNNGGDGYVLAALLHERGLKVTIWQVGQEKSLKEEARAALTDCQKLNIAIHSFNETSDLNHPDVIVDAICGIGIKGELRKDIVTAIVKMQQTKAPIFAIDVPTGINADTGQVLGLAVRATVTLTFIGLKLGLLTGSGIAYTGKLLCHDLQLPEELYSYVKPVAEKSELSTYAAYLKPRSRDWHKGLSGHVLIVGGEVGFSGAVRMAAEAALRVGAGLVTIATREENAITMNLTCPEIMCRGITQIEDLRSLIAKADTIVIGPGLGQSEWSKWMWKEVCQQNQPLVVDADGLNLLAQDIMNKENWVLTPHPGEAARLLNKTASFVQQDRLSAIQSIHDRCGGVCVLKGAGTLVLATNTLPTVCEKGNPGMASAGMGDILSGVIGGLIAQGIPLSDAANLGVMIHAIAGDLAAKEGERGMIATDLLPYLRKLSNLNIV